MRVEGEGDGRGAQVASERLSFAVSASQSPPLNDKSLVTAGIADPVADERVGHSFLSYSYRSHNCRSCSQQNCKTSYKLQHNVIAANLALVWPRIHSLRIERTSLRVTFGIIPTISEITIGYRVRSHRLG